MSAPTVCMYRAGWVVIAKTGAIEGVFASKQVAHEAIADMIDAGVGAASSMVVRECWVPGDRLAQLDLEAVCADRGLLLATRNPAAAGGQLDLVEHLVELRRLCPEHADVLDQMTARAVELQQRQSPFAEAGSR